jgi:hypothetical protein
LALLPLYKLNDLKPEAKKPVILLLISLLAWTAYNIYKGHDPLPSFRFFVLFMPFIYLLMTQGLAIFYDTLVGLRQNDGWTAKLPGLFATLIIGLLVFQSFILGYLSTSLKPQMQEYQVQINKMNATWGFSAIGKMLKQVAPAGAKIAVIDAGAIPYYSECYTIDRWGLIDPYVARLKGQGSIGEKFDAEYVLKQKPEFIQTKMYYRHYEHLRSRDHVNISDFDWPGDMYLFKNQVFIEEYEICDDPILDGFFVRADLMPLIGKTDNPDVIPK